MDATPLVLALESLVGGEVTQGSANPGLKYGRPLAFGEASARLLKDLRAEEKAAAEMFCLSFHAAQQEVTP